MTKTKDPELTAKEQQLLDLLAKDGKCAIKEISTTMDISASGVVDLAQQIGDKGISIWKNGKELYLGSTQVEAAPEDVVIKSNELKVGFIADTILGSKYEQPTALCQAFQIAEHEGVDLMIHLGVSAGKPTPAKKDEFHKLTAKEQIAYIVANYPKSPKFKTRFISGHHDMQWRKDKTAVNILAEVCAQRDDLLYKGDWQANFRLRRSLGADIRWPVLKAAYHGGDDTPYSKSYPVQGFAENLVQDVEDLFADDMSDIVAVAGQGVFCDLSGGKIEHLFSMPGIRMVSPSVMKKKRRSVVPTIGLAILTIKFDKDGNFFVTKKGYPLSSIKRDYSEKISDDEAAVKKLNDDERAVINLLEDSPKSLGEISQALNRSNKSVVDIIASLQKKGMAIKEPQAGDAAKTYRLLIIPKSKFKASKINFADYFHTTLEEGAVSDTHFGHHSELLEILHGAYDVFAKRGIKRVNHGGDITNGPPKHAEHLNGEVREFRATALTNDVIALYPAVEGITTDAIAGDHDRWFQDMTGYDLLDQVAKVRKDIVYRGVQQGEKQQDRFITLLRHYNWGTGYARSYKPQQVIEDGILKEMDKEAALYRGKVVIVLSGGGHVFCAMLYKGIIFILLPCLQGKTGFITGLGKLSDVGFIIYSITHNKSGILTRFSIEFFDRGAEALALVRQKTLQREQKRLDALKVGLTHLKKT